MTKPIRFYLTVAVAATVTGIGGSLLTPAPASATEEAAVIGDAAAGYGNLYVDPNGTPKSVCICRDAATECAPCISLP